MASATARNYGDEVSFMSSPPSAYLLLTAVLACAGCGASSNPVDANSVGGATASSRTGPGATGGAGTVPVVGGAQSVGGTVAIGGTTSNVSGGASARAGSSGTGGSNSIGGLAAIGGSSGAGASGTGGSRATAGASAAGGTRTTGGSETAGGAGNFGGSAGSGGSTGVTRSSVNATGGIGTAVGSSTLGGATSTGGASAIGGAPGTGGVSSGALIRNDVFWKDLSGTPIYSQGGGVLRVGSTYYWYGVKYNGAVTYATKPTSLNSDTTFAAVTIYSSTDLANWKFEDNALTPASLTAAGADPSNWIGRVGAAYNATTKKYVLNGQYGGTPDTAQFFATSSTPNGPFTWERTQATITNVVNNNCGDQSIFNDDDGKAYLVCSSLSGRSNLYVAPLRAADYLNVEPATRVFGGAGREGNAMFKYAGRYYLCSSDLHGWNASHSYYISATNILGPYGAEGVIGGTDADFSHVTQTGLFITVPGTSQSTVIFGGDRWSDFAGNGIGYNQWTPLTFDGTTPRMQSMTEWTLDVVSGTWGVGGGNNYALNPSFEADRVSVTQPAGWTTSNGSNLSGGRTGRWAWQLTGTSALNQTITDLPNGTYTLSVWIKSSASGAQLYAKATASSTQTATIAAASTWTNLSIADIAVSNGQCDIGVSSSGQTVALDDFTFVKG